MENKCLWLVYSSYHLLNFTFSHLTVWTARPTLRAVLQKTDCPLLMEMPISVVVVVVVVVLNTLWNSYLNQATKNVYTYLYLPNFFIPKEIPWWKFWKQKRNPFIISVTSTLPSPSNPHLRPGLRANVIVCAVLISVADQCRSSNKESSTQYVRIGESNRSVERHFTINSARSRLLRLLILQHAIWLASA